MLGGIVRVGYPGLRRGFLQHFFRRDFEFRARRQPTYQLAPEPGSLVSPAFSAARRQYLTLELIATSLFYVVIV